MAHTPISEEPEVDATVEAPPAVSGEASPPRVAKDPEGGYAEWVEDRIPPIQSVQESVNGGLQAIRAGKIVNTFEKRING